MDIPVRKTELLRLGRFSAASARYFLTLCTQQREPVLVHPQNAERIAKTWHALQLSGDITLLAATTMPDHVHALFILGERLSFSQVMGKFKTLSSDHGKERWRWQQNGFEHRLRTEEDSAAYGFYIFMNPYKAQLAPLSAQWPWWQSSEPTRMPFLEHLIDGCPRAEWLDQADTIAKRVVVGE